MTGSCMSSEEELIKGLDQDLRQIVPDPNFKMEPLKRPPRYGVFLTWPIDGNDWIHPEDVERANQMIPSNRVFRREDLDSEFSILTYGNQTIRVRPSMWLEIEHDGYEMGDTVEIKSDFGRQKPMIARIAEVYWNKREQRIEYVLKQEGRIIESRLTANDFRMVIPINETPTVRQMMMVDRKSLR